MTRRLGIEGAGEEEDGVEKVEIAARAALNLLGALQAKDRVAVLAVTETATIVMPLVSPAQASKYVPQIEAVEAGGGGIDCRNGLEAAYTLLQTSDAQIKHVIICPDTTDSEQQDGCVTLAAAEYNASKISTSVCGIGEWSDHDVPFQKELSSAGHGQLFVANQAGNLPQFFQRDVQNVEQKLIAEGIFKVEGAASDPVADVFGFAPILGYNLVTPKAGSLTPVTLSGHDDPLLSYWRHGVGKSFAFTADDDAHWSRLWLSEPNYPTFWAHLVRWSMKSGEDDSFQTFTTDIKGDGHIVVDAYNSGGYSVDSHFLANIAGPDGSVDAVSLHESAPGRYEGSFSASTVGGYLVQIRNEDSGGHQTSSVTTPYSSEYADLRPDIALLKQLSNGTGGEFLKFPEQSFRREKSFNIGELSLTNSFALLACALFVLDIAWRRFGWRLGKRTAEIAGNKVREGALVAAGSIKSAIKRPAIDVLDRKPTAKVVKSADVNMLANRTAVRANLDEDDPFPFVASLPPRNRRDTAPDSSKENQ